MSNQEQLATTLLVERLIPVEEVPSIVPPGRNGRPLHRSAVWRWVSKGLRDSGGVFVRLEAVMIGRRFVTSREALARFFARLTPGSAGAEGQAAPSARGTPRESTVAILARHGIAIAPHGVRR